VVCEFQWSLSDSKYGSEGLLLEAQSLFYAEGIRDNRTTIKLIKEKEKHLHRWEIDEGI